MTQLRLLTVTTTDCRQTSLFLARLGSIPVERPFSLGYHLDVTIAIRFQRSVIAHNQSQLQPT